MTTPGRALRPWAHAMANHYEADLTALEVIEALLAMVASKEAEIAELRHRLRLDSIVLDADELGLEPRESIPSILIVARGSLTTDILHMLFQRAGYADVHECNDLAEARGMAENYRPDIVVYDAEGWDSHGVNTRFIGELNRQMRGAALIAILPDGNHDDLLCAAREGATDVLIKPIDTMRLIHVVRRIVEDGVEAYESRLPG